MEGYSGIDRIDVKKISLTEYKYKMRSGDLPAYLSLNGVVYIIDAHLFNFSLKRASLRNSFLTDGRKDGPTDGRPYPSYRNVETCLK